MRIRGVRHRNMHRDSGCLVALHVRREVKQGWSRRGAREKER